MAQPNNPLTHLETYVNKAIDRLNEAGNNLIEMIAAPLNKATQAAHASEKGAGLDIPNPLNAIKNKLPAKHGSSTSITGPDNYKAKKVGYNAERQHSLSLSPSKGDHNKMNTMGIASISPKAMLAEEKYGTARYVAEDVGYNGDLVSPGTGGAKAKSTSMDGPGPG